MGIDQCMSSMQYIGPLMFIDELFKFGFSMEESIFSASAVGHIEPNQTKIRYTQRVSKTSYERI